MPAKILAIHVSAYEAVTAVLDVATSTLAGPAGRSAFKPVEDEGAAEIAAEALWSALTAAARQVTRSEQDIEAIGLCCFTGGPVLLGDRGQPLLPIWLPRDSRSRPAARQVWADVGEEFLGTTGCRPLPGKTSAVVFRQQHHEDNYLTHRVRSYFDINGWLAYRLTGAKHCGLAGACASGLFGTLTDRQWSPRWCEYFEVERAWLPPVVAGDTTVGHLQCEAASDLGLPPGLPVKLGTDEIASVALAANLAPGDLLDMAGPGSNLLVARADRPWPDRDRWTRLLGVGDAMLYVSEDPTPLRALDWVRQLCFREQSESTFWQESLAEAQKRSTRVALEPAYLCDDAWEIETHRAAFRDLTLKSDRIDLLAAALRAICTQYARARSNVGIDGTPRRLFLVDQDVELFERLVPDCTQSKKTSLQNAALRGIAKLF
jgi:sugar (pentulose or hexulose) kinase